MGSGGSAGLRPEATQMHRQRPNEYRAAASIHEMLGTDTNDEFKDEVDSALDDGEVAVSAITFVETTRLHHHGRINLGQHPEPLWVLRREHHLSLWSFQTG